jgi:subtilisin-like proprotein convertase family protein
VATFTTSSNLVSGTHTIKAEYSGGGSYLATDASISLYVNAHPILTTNRSTQSVCTDVPFEAITFSGSSITTWQWIRSNPENLSGMETLGPINPTEISGVLYNKTLNVQTSTFTIIGTDSNGCSSTVNSDVVVNPSPFLANISGPSSVCQYLTIPLLSSPEGGVWSSNDESVASVNSSTGVVSGLSTGSAVISYQLTDGLGCINTVVKPIVVNAAPTSSVTADASTICYGESTQITGSTPIQPPVIITTPESANNGFVDFMAGSPLGILDKTIIIQNLPFSSLDGVTITVTVNVDHARAQEVEMYLIPPFELTSTIFPVTYGGTTPTQSYTVGRVVPLLMHNGGATPGFTNTTFSDAGQNITTGTTPFTGIYRPYLPLSSFDTDIDPNGPWTLRIVDSWNTWITGKYNSWSITFSKPGSGTGDVIWSTGPTQDAAFETSAGNSPGTYPVSPSLTTTYTLTAIALNGCEIPSSATITVIPKTVADAGVDQNNCGDDTFTLAANAPTLGTGTWSITGPGSISDPSSPTSTVTGVPVGSSTTLRWTIQNPFCADSYDEVVLTNYEKPIATAPIICVGESDNLTSTEVCPNSSQISLRSPTLNTTDVFNNPANSEWSNLLNIYSSENNYATVTLQNGGNSSTSYYLNAKKFGFTIPAGATINGIMVEIERQANGIGVSDARIQLLKTSGRVGNIPPSTAWPTIEAYQTFGGMSNLWGTTWTATEINSDDFGVQVAAVNSSGSILTANIDHIRITVSYTLTGTIDWYTGGGIKIGSGTPFYPIGKANSGIPNNTTPGSFPFYSQCSTTGCQSEVVNFVINPAPVTPSAFTASPPVVCLGASGVVYSVANDPNVTYNWSYSGTPIPGNSNSISMNFPAGSTSGTLSVTATSINGCGTSSALTLPITVGKPSQPGAITGPNSTCEGVSQTYSVAAITGATSYIWTLPGGWTGTSATNSITVTPGSVSGDISVAAKNDCGTSGPSILAVTVNAKSQGSLTGSTICSGTTGKLTFTSLAGQGPFTLIITSPLVPNTYTYTNVTSGTPFDAVPSPINYSATPYPFTLTTIIDANGCSRTSGITTPAATITTLGLTGTTGSFPTSPLNVCQGATNVIFSVTGGNNATSYYWTFNRSSGTVVVSQNGTGITLPTSTTTPTVITAA